MMCLFFVGFKDESLNYHELPRLGGSKTGRLWLFQ